MVVETSSSGKITTSGNPWIFRISPTSAMEAQSFGTKVGQFNIKKANFLVVNNDWGWAHPRNSRRCSRARALPSRGGNHDAKATDMSAQLAKIKSAGGDTVFVTTGVEQITLVLKQMKEQRVTQRVITTGGSSSPDQLIAQRPARPRKAVFTCCSSPPGSRARRPIRRSPPRSSMNGTSAATTSPV